MCFILPHVFRLPCFKAVFQTLLGLPYAVLWPSISLGGGRPWSQLSADACRQTECVLPGHPQPVDRGLPFHHQPSAQLHIISIVLSFNSLHLLITFPIASTPKRLLSSVLGCLSLIETPHIHLTILISVLSIFGSIFYSPQSQIYADVSRMCNV